MRLNMVIYIFTYNDHSTRLRNLVGEYIRPLLAKSSTWSYYTTNTDTTKRTIVLYTVVHEKITVEIPPYNHVTTLIQPSCLPHQNASADLHFRKSREFLTTAQPPLDMSQLDLSGSPRVDPELQSDVDCLILDYLVCLAIEQTFSAAETPLDKNKAEEADWLVASLNGK